MKSESNGSFFVIVALMVYIQSFRLDIILDQEPFSGLELSTRYVLTLTSHRV